jgi:hypothetical protein
MSEFIRLMQYDFPVKRQNLALSSCVCAFKAQGGDEDNRDVRQARVTIDAWLGEPKDSLIPYFVPVLTQDDVEPMQPHVRPRTPHQAELWTETCVKDFAVRPARAKKANRAWERNGQKATDPLAFNPIGAVLARHLVCDGFETRYCSSPCWMIMAVDSSPWKVNAVLQVTAPRMGE